MCLSVFIGSHEPIPFGNVPEGGLGIGAAKWTPPALSKFPHRCYLGRMGAGEELECSCLLAQHVEWTDAGPKVSVGNQYQPKQCHFDDLRRYLSLAQRSRKPVVLACDDSGGSPQACSNNDYDHLLISLEMVSAKSYLFADPLAAFPWRVFYLNAPDPTL